MVVFVSGMLPQRLIGDERFAVGEAFRRRFGAIDDDVLQAIERYRIDRLQDAEEVDVLEAGPESQDLGARA